MSNESGVPQLVVPNIPGAMMSSFYPRKPPSVMIVSPPKTGKSAAVISLIGWQNKYPLVLPFDPTGPDVCNSLGHPVPIWPINNDKRIPYYDRCMATIDGMERSGRITEYNCIVTDCVSTLMRNLLREVISKYRAEHQNKSPKDKRSLYGVASDQCKEIIDRIFEFNLPTVWLSWLDEATIDESSGNRKIIMGGPLFEGKKLRAFLSGIVDQILILEKVKVPANDPLICIDGYKRILHTKTWEHINAGGRYATKLPDPCPLNLGYVFDRILAQS